jgi:hypothetical protein
MVSAAGCFRRSHAGCSGAPNARRIGKQVLTQLPPLAALGPSASDLGRRTAAVRGEGADLVERQKQRGIEPCAGTPLPAPRGRDRTTPHPRTLRMVLSPSAATDAVGILARWRRSERSYAGARRCGRRSAVRGRRMSGTSSGAAAAERYGLPEESVLPLVRPDPPSEPGRFNRRRLLLPPGAPGPTEIAYSRGSET